MHFLHLVVVDGNKQQVVSSNRLVVVFFEVEVPFAVFFCTAFSGFSSERSHTPISDGARSFPLSFDDMGG